MPASKASLDFATAFARLLSDRDARVQFRENRNELARRFGVVGSNRAAFLALDPDSLDVQADGLIRKRMREVSKRLPDTWMSLGDVSATRLFRMYASHNWPTGHGRHVQDALEFGRYLLHNCVPGVCRAELNQLQFSRSGQPFAARLVRHAEVDGKQRPAVQILYRWRREPRSLLVYLRI